MEESVVIAPRTPANSPTDAQPRPKRTRAALACQRCKYRKQRCDGAQPSCSTCIRLKAECHYVIQANYKPKAAKLYITALEDRIAELETSLAGRDGARAGDDHWSQPTAPDDDLDPLFSAVRDLSLNTGGSYVGGTSNITLARFLGSVVGAQGSSSLKYSFSPESNVVTEDSNYDSPLLYETTAPLMVGDEVAEKLVETFIKYISPRLPVLHPSHIRNLYERRNELSDPYGKAVLHLVFALAGGFLVEANGDNVDYHSEDHLEAALNSRDAILALGDARTLIYLLLLGQQCLRVPKKMGAWTLVGLAMRLCIELGLHRRKRIKVRSVRSEIEKRLFWSCYYLDRELSVSLGRPTSIADHDIDVELPLDVDDTVQDVAVFELAAEQDQSQPASPPTTLTYFIHLIRLKQIQSDIQNTIYRVDRSPGAAGSDEATNEFLDRLAAWNAAIPPHVGNWDVTYREDVYVVSYHRCVRLLLQPQLYAKTVNERYLELCMDSCRGVCEGYKRMYHHMPVAFSSLTLQTIFIAGLTLVYCVWYKHSGASVMLNYNALNDCSVMLYIMCQQATGGL